ncbi:MAG: hypothetical protein HOP28_16310 [Gemmatimonadales bacterium]|nr:hypothetical protein [Gemmatimonadales bacterium]
MRRLTLVCLLVSGCTTSAPTGVPLPSPSWSRLERGPHRVGLSVLSERDSSRPSFQASSTPTPGRPMQIVVWYPAAVAAGEPATLRHYIELSAGTLGPDSGTTERRRQLADDFIRERLANGLGRPAIDSVLHEPMGAMLGVPRARGRFPLLVFLHTTPWGASAMSEYLASHGFVVAAIESKGAQEAAYRLSRENLDAMVLDAAFTVSRMRREVNVDERLGIIGMSNGSIAAVALQLVGIVPQGVVSLDGGIGERAGGTYLAQRSGGDLKKFTVPLLHLYGPDNPSLDFQYLRSYEAASRMLVQVGRLRHRDFLTYGLLERALPGAFGTAPPEASIGFEAVSRYTRNFLQWHMTGNARARRFLADSAERNAPPGLLTIERLPTRIAPP